MHGDLGIRLRWWARRAASALAGALALACLFGLLAAGCTKPEGARPVMSGQALFGTCVACHGQRGEGNYTFKTPALAGLPAWYVEAQLVKFQTGVRGGHPDDVDGLRMRPMSRQLMNRAEVVAVAQYVATLAPAIPPPVITGGRSADGAALFGVCVACHGPKAQGNEQLKAPPLAQQSDWYLVAQLTKFKDGVRGAHPDDVTGAQMRPMAMTLVDEQAMKNVVAHIGTLRP